MKYREWDEDELRSAVRAYVNLLYLPDERVKIADAIRRQRKRALAGRTENAVRKRLCNISYIRNVCGLRMVRGLPPLSHIGDYNEQRIMKLLDELNAPS